MVILFGCVFSPLSVVQAEPRLVQAEGQGTAQDMEHAQMVAEINRQANEQAYAANQLAYARETAQLNRTANAQMLGLQQEIQQDTRKFQTISNIMKAKHDTQKNALGNMR